MLLHDLLIAKWYEQEGGAVVRATIRGWSVVGGANYRRRYASPYVNSAETRGAPVAVDVAHPYESDHDLAVRGLDQAEEYVAGICFKTGPPELLGVELEWTVHHASDLTRPVDNSLLARALHPHAPPTVDPDTDQAPLPNGSVLSVEPGGQVEISTQPHSSLAALYAAADHDVAYLTDLLARSGLALGDSAIDAHRPAHRVLHTPRYDAMAEAFTADGPHGRIMMCSTAGLQVCVDAGEPERVVLRWAALHALGPVLLAVFANSRNYAGQRTGWASTRMRAWLGMDPARTGPVPASGDPASDWARYALRAPVLFVRRDGRSRRCPPRTSFADWINGRLDDRPTYSDLDLHLSTLFPPVRPRGYLEIRYLDQQASREWHAAVAVVAALLIDDASVDAVRDLCMPTDGLWTDAARYGLAHPQIAATARAVMAFAGQQLSRTSLPQEICDEVNESVSRRLADGMENTT